MDKINYGIKVGRTPGGKRLKVIHRQVSIPLIFCTGRYYIMMVRVNRCIV